MTTHDAARHFQDKLAYETDPADVWDALKNDQDSILIVDCRSAGNYTKTHLPGAISLPWEGITEERARDLPDRPIITYCWGLAFNAATKGGPAGRVRSSGQGDDRRTGVLDPWRPSHRRSPPGSSVVTRNPSIGASSRRSPSAPPV